MFCSTVDNRLQINSSNLAQEIPRCMYVNKEELLPDKHKQVAYNFPNGNFNHLELKYFRSSCCCEGVCRAVGSSFWLGGGCWTLRKI